MQPDVSHLLVRWSEGDDRALEELIPIVYANLRLLGRSALRRQGRESILPPTVLVDEAWLRIAGNHQLSLRSQRQFYALAAKIMRDILIIDHVRRRRAAKRGGSQVEIALDEANPAVHPRYVDFLILDEAITRTEEIGVHYSSIVELRYFAGLTIEETAEVLNVSHATIDREWNFARAWLRRELQPGRFPTVDPGAAR
jgi:RNA polymerase sigma-70 factor (ECF subfamily)